MITHFASGYFDPQPFLLLEPAPTPAEAAVQEYATILTGGHSSAQGPVVRRMRDGRITIRLGETLLTGKPVNAGPQPSMLGRIFGRDPQAAAETWRVIPG
ncbi:hypothetical protein ACFSCT_13080 [Paracoccus pacificus]|uniref:Uncharacterized protein n=2 Tax=Paracoccus pacificus TaxID=1463598 RepID=A0ABW4R9D4_9RHOB